MPFQQAPPDPVLPGFAFAFASHPYRGETVNGDALFVEMGRADGAFLLLLIDVMGHGRQTVVTMDTLRNTLGDPVYEDCQPAELLRRLHGVLEPQFLVTGNFAAAIAVLCSRHDDAVKAANAGQPEPWLRRPGADWETWSLPGGLLLGAPDPGATYQETGASLPAAGSLLAFTDGVTEAGAHSHLPQFQQARLPAFLGGLPSGKTPGEVVN